MNILDLLIKDGIKPFETGKKWKSSCPKCGGSDRFSIWPDQLNKNGKYSGGRYYCNGCGISGDGCDYLQMQKGMDFKESCQLLGLETMPGRNSNNPRTRGKPFIKPLPIYIDPSEVWQVKAENFVKYCHEQLVRNDQVMKWLAVERGITVETVRKYRIGWNPETLYRPLGLWGLPEELNKATGKPRKQWLPGGLVIPNNNHIPLVLGSSKTITRLRIRMNEEVNGSKYAVIRGSSMAPMVFWNNQSAVCIVESELDCLLLAQECGDMIGVIAMGSAQSRPDAALNDRLMAIKLILCSLDADEPGDRESSWWTRYQGFRRLRPIAGKDPAEMFKAGLSVREWIMEGIS